MLFLLVKIQKEGAALPFRICHNNQIGHGLVIDLHQWIIDIESNVFHKLRLLLVHFDFVHINGKVCSNEKVEIIPKKETECQYFFCFLKSKFDFFSGSIFQKQKYKSVF